MALLGSLFSGSEIRCSTFEKEPFAIYQVFKKLYYLLMAKEKVHLFTYHNNILLFLQSIGNWSCSQMPSCEQSLEVGSIPLNILLNDWALRRRGKHNVRHKYQLVPWVQRQTPNSEGNQSFSPWGRHRVISFFGELQSARYRYNFLLTAHVWSWRGAIHSERHSSTDKRCKDMDSIQRCNVTTENTCSPKLRTQRPQRPRSYFHRYQGAFHLDHDEWVLLWIYISLCPLFVWYGRAQYSLY